MKGFTQCYSRQHGVVVTSKVHVPALPCVYDPEYVF